VSRDSVDILYSSSPLYPDSELRLIYGLIVSSENAKVFAFLMSLFSDFRQLNESVEPRSSLISLFLFSSAPIFLISFKLLI